MRYVLLIGSDDKAAPPGPRAEMEAIVQGHRRFADELCGRRGMPPASAPRLASARSWTGRSPRRRRRSAAST